MPTHAELKSLTHARLSDAQVLYDATRYDAAAYMCGYVLELALKACICKRLRLASFPPDRLAKAFKTHSFEDLKLLAGLTQEITAGSNATLFANWSVVEGWKPEWRYEPTGSKNQAEVDAMLNALREKPYGVLTWLKKRW